NHALVRQTLYGALNPSRRARLHRSIAEAMEAVYAERAVERAADIAAHYHRSKELRGAERGAEYAIAATDRAAAAYAHDLVASLLRLALGLLPPDNRRRPRLLARLGPPPVCSLDFRGGPRVLPAAGGPTRRTGGAPPPA